MTDGQHPIVQKVDDSQFIQVTHPAEFTDTVYDQDLYASDLLYVLSLSLAKTSVLRFLQKICFAFWVAICPVDIITELVICILPGFVIKPVQVASGKKFTVVIAFVFRIFVVITTIVRLVFIKKTQSLADMNTSSFATVITTQTNLCVSLMTACIPCLKPFLDAFDSGMLNVSLHKRASGGYSSSSGAGNGNSYALASLSRGTKESSNRSRYADDDIEGLGTSAAAFAVTTPSAGRLLDLDGDANGSTMAIQRTDQWSVRCEYVDQKDSRPIGDDAEISEVRENNGEHVSL
ncbi:hypothetical protein N7528_001015 [Penicillium herquei]|nr:hypothetical protein N7528_001015 [Penicillium herquei]